MKQNKIILPSVFLLLFVAYMVVLAAIPNGYNDMREHAAFAREMLSGVRPTAGNFMFYWLVNIFSLFSGNIRFSEISLCLLLAGATTYRLYWSQKKIVAVTASGKNSRSDYWLSFGFAASLLFVFAITIQSYSLDEFMYIGNYV